MATGDNIQLRVVGRYQDQNIVNNFCYNLENQVTGDQDILEQACIDWDTQMRSAWLAAHHTTYTLVGLKAFRINGTPKTPGFSTIGQPGTRSGTAAPNFVCRTITLYSTSTNFRRRGRAMLSGSIVEDFDVTDGSLTVGAKAVLDTLGALLSNGFAPAVDGYSPILKPNGALPEVPIVDYASRETPSSVTRRRIRQYLIG